MRSYDGKPIDARWLDLFSKRLEQLYYCATATTDQVSMGDFLAIRARLADYFHPLVELMLGSGLLYLSVDGDGDKFTGCVSGIGEIVIVRDIYCGSDLCVHVPVMDDYRDEPICEQE